MKQLILPIVLLTGALLIFVATGVFFVLGGYTLIVNRLCMVGAITSFLAYCSLPKERD